MLTLSQREKIKRVMELLKKGIPIREISKEVKMSNTTICHINKRMALYEKEKSITEPIEILSPETDSSITAISVNDALSKHSQGLKLLIEKKSLVEILIILDLDTNDVLNIHNDFLILQKRAKLAGILIAQKNNLDSFINLDSYIAKNNIDLREIWYKIGLEEENFKLREENKKLKFEKETAVDTKEFWKEQFGKVNDKYQNLLNLAKRKKLISVQYASRSFDNRF